MMGKNTPEVCGNCGHSAERHLYAYGDDREARVPKPLVCLIGCNPRKADDVCVYVGASKFEPRTVPEGPYAVLEWLRSSNTIDTGVCGMEQLWVRKEVAEQAVLRAAGVAEGLDEGDLAVFSRVVPDVICRAGEENIRTSESGRKVKVLRYRHSTPRRYDDAYLLAVEGDQALIARDGTGKTEWVDVSLIQTEDEDG